MSYGSNRHSLLPQEWVRWCDQIIRCMCNLPIKNMYFCTVPLDLIIFYLFFSLLSPPSLVKPKWRLMPCFKTHCVYNLPIKNITSFSTCIDIILERLCKMVKGWEESKKTMSYPLLDSWKRMGNGNGALFKRLIKIISFKNILQRYVTYIVSFPIHGLNLLPHLLP